LAGISAPDNAFLASFNGHIRNDFTAHALWPEDSAILTWYSDDFNKYEYNRFYFRYQSYLSC